MSVISLEEDHRVPGVVATFLRQLGYQTRGLTRGFASPSRDGFALIKKGSSLCAIFFARAVPNDPIRLRAMQMTVNRAEVEPRCPTATRGRARDSVSTACRFDNTRGDLDNLKFEKRNALIALRISNNSPM